MKFNMIYMKFKMINMTFKKIFSKESFDGVIHVVDIHAHDTFPISMKFNITYIKFNVNI